MTGARRTVPGVLVAVDQPHLADAVSDALSPLGVDCIRVVLGPGRSEPLREADHALVVLDAALDSEEARQIVGRARACGTPVLAVTDPSDPALELLCEQGPLDCLARPASPSLLRAKVRGHLELLARAAPIGESASLLTLQADIGIALAAHGDLRSCLKACAEALVQHVDAAFARIWTLNDADHVLELQASAGMYTHLDGPHAACRSGSSRSASSPRNVRHISRTTVVGDPRVGNQEWAVREGMVAFAGLPTARRRTSWSAWSPSSLVASSRTTRCVRRRRSRAASRRRSSEPRARARVRVRAVVRDHDPAQHRRRRDRHRSHRDDVTFLNQVATSLTGWSIDDGTSANRCTRSSRSSTRTHARSVESPVDKVLREGVSSAWRTTRCFCVAMAAKHPIDDSAAPIRDDADKLMGVVLVFRDASEKRRASRTRADLLEREQAARGAGEAERERLYPFLMQAPAVICVLKGPVPCLRACESALPADGRRPRDRRQDRCSGSAARAEGPGLRRAARRRHGERRAVRRQRRSRSPSFATRAANRRRRSYDFVYQPMRDAEGKVEGILVHAVEVTEQVRARDGLEEAVAGGSAAERASSARPSTCCEASSTTFPSWRGRRAPTGTSISTTGAGTSTPAPRSSRCRAGAGSGSTIPSCSTR